MATLTNTTSSPALNGQAAKVTLSSAEAATYLQTIVKGQACTVTSSSKKGTVYSVDYNGLSFLVAPMDDATRFDSTSTPGILAATDTVVVTI